MAQTSSSTKPDQPLSMAKPILIGAGVGLIVISFFVFGVNAPHPEWGKLWMIRPLIITPVAGAMGGAFYAFMDHLTSKGLNRTVAVIVSLIVFAVGLWLGTILGLAGTMWH